MIILYFFYLFQTPYRHEKINEKREEIKNDDAEIHLGQGDEVISEKTFFALVILDVLCAVLCCVSRSLDFSNNCFLSHSDLVFFFVVVYRF